jgi:hypothetical protein
MAYFAELDKNNIVLRVVVIDDNCVPSNEHVDGENWCIKFFKGGTWKQTCRNNSFRKQYAAKGYTYDASKNKFIAPQPFASWSLDANDDWQPPITYPTITDDGATPPIWIYVIKWNETKYQADNTKGWEAFKSNDEGETPIKYDWNGTSWITSQNI